MQYFVLNNQRLKSLKRSHLPCPSRSLWKCLPCRRAVVNLTFVRLPSSQTKKTYLFSHTTMYKRRKSRLNCTEEEKKGTSWRLLTSKNGLFLYCTDLLRARTPQEGANEEAASCQVLALTLLLVLVWTSRSRRRTLFIPFSVFCLKTLNSCLLRTAQMYL